MKKLSIIFTALALMAGAMPAYAAKSAADLRIYIDPGHGGFGSGDRHQGTVKHGLSTAVNGVYKDTTGFFESNTNLWKCMGLLDKLRSYGLKFDAAKGGRDFTNNIVMSRVKNFNKNGGPDLSEVSAEADANNFDLFICVHSNAATEGSTANYPLFLYRGYDSPKEETGVTLAHQNTSRAMSKTVWPFAYANAHMRWSSYSATNVNLRGDLNFYSGAPTTNSRGQKGYLGALRHGVPGFLVEGYFHTYQPARHRAMNPDVCRMEGYGYARGIAEYFGIAKEKIGDIYGIIRDKNRKFTHTYYTGAGGSDDEYKPINNASVTLLDKDGKTVATYKTDDEYNGAFVFPDIPVGSYTVKVSANGYVDASATCTVTAAATAYPKVFIEEVGFVPDNTHPDYPEVVTDPSFASSSYSLETVYADKAIDALAGTTIRRVIARGDNLYILAHKGTTDKKQPVLVVLSTDDLSLRTTVSTEGCEGTESPLSDIQVTNDGVLIGSACELNHYNAAQVKEGETLGKLNIYKWTNDANGLPSGKPAVWITTQSSANLYRAYVGNTFAYTGSSTTGRLAISAQNASNTTGNIWIVRIPVTSGKGGTANFTNKTITGLNAGAVGTDYSFTISPESADHHIVNSPKMAPKQMLTSDNTVHRDIKSGLLPNAAGNEGYFKFGGQSLMVAGRYDASGVNTGVTLLDVTKGIDNASAVTTSGTTLPAYTGMAGCDGQAKVIKASDGSIEWAGMNLFLVRDGKVSKFSSPAPDFESQTRSHYAYDLRAVKKGTDYELSFRLTGAATARLYIESITFADEFEPFLIAEGDFNEGLNTVVVDANRYAGLFSWRVEVDNARVLEPSLIFDTKHPANGVAINHFTDSDRFGTIYQTRSDGTKGYTLYTPDHKLVNATPYASTWSTTFANTCWRAAVMPDGSVLSSDFSDNNGGIYRFDPANPADGARLMFAMDSRSSSGEITYGGKIIGGSTAGVAVYADANGTHVFSAQEDYPTANKKSIVRYDIGNATSITAPPAKTFDKLTAKMINGNVDIDVNRHGILVSQVRSQGNNNSGVPSFIFADHDGNILYSGHLQSPTLNGSKGSSALSPDGDRIAVTDHNGVIHIYELTNARSAACNEIATIALKSHGATDLNTFQLNFDPAGNLYVANRTALKAFAVPSPARTVTTPSPSSQYFTGIATGVGSVEADSDATAPVEFFNLNGVRVDGSNLAPGIYIRRQGNKAEKIIVK